MIDLCYDMYTTSGGTLAATLLLEGWCAYFLPVCILGYRYFDQAEKKPETFTSRADRYGL